MNYSITISDDGTYIILKSTGELNGAQIMERSIEAHKLGRLNNIHKYLVDNTGAVNIGSIPENFELVFNKFMRSAEIDHRAVVAVAVPPEDRAQKILELAMRSAGYNVKIFFSLQEAIDHLNSY